LERGKGGHCATFCSMIRARISTTVDAERLRRVRDLLGTTDSELIDRALDVLIAQVLAERETAALAAMPYEEDADLAWATPPGPDLPYDGDIPAGVRELAERRRTSR
jgi:hypothetical protein